MRKYRDKNLSSLLKSGNLHAFNEVYEKYHQALYRNILKIIKDPVASEDLLQEVFLKLWENRAKIKKDKSLGGWLFTVSFNKAVNYLKKESTRLNVKESIQKIRLNELETSISDDKFEQRYHLLELAVSKLPPKRRKTFVLCKLEGKTHKEAAKILNISKYTVKEYLSLAMKTIKQYIEGHSQYPNLLKGIVLISFSVYLILK